MKISRLGNRNPEKIIAGRNHCPGSLCILSADGGTAPAGTLRKGYAAASDPGPGSGSRIGLCSRTADTADNTRATDGEDPHSSAWIIPAAAPGTARAPRRR